MLKKNTANKILFLFLFLFFIILFAKSTHAANWVLYGKNRWYDASSTQRHSNQNVSVWVKSILENNLVKQLEKEIRDAGLNISYSNYGYSINLFTYDCRARSMSTTMGTDYNKNGEIISSFDLPTRPFKPITPESSASVLYGIMCK